MLKKTDLASFVDFEKTTTTIKIIDNIIDEPSKKHKIVFNASELGCNDLFLLDMSIYLML